MPPIIQNVQGQGVALLNAGGTVVSRTLGPGEKLLIDSHSLVAFTDGIGYDVQQVRWDTYALAQRYAIFSFSAHSKRTPPVMARHAFAARHTLQP